MSVYKYKFKNEELPLRSGSGSFSG